MAARDVGACALALLAPARELPALGAAVALAAAAHRRAPAALLLRWSAAPVAGAGGAAAPAARRIAAALAARGHEPLAAGRLAILPLPGDPDHAARAAGQALAVAGRAPTVLALCVRHEAFDAILAAHDAILVRLAPDAAPALAELAVGPAVDGVPTASRLDVGLGLPARALARAGLAAPRAVRHAVAEALG